MADLVTPMEVGGSFAALGGGVAYAGPGPRGGPVNRPFARSQDCSRLCPRQDSNLRHQL